MSEENADQKMPRQAITTEVLWSMTAWPPARAWPSLGLGQEPLGRMQELSDTLGVVSRLLREAPTGDYVLKLETEAYSDPAFQSFGSTGVRMSVCFFSVSALVFGSRNAADERARIASWCDRLSGEMKKEAAPLWFCANIGSLVFRIEESLSLAELARAVQEIRKGMDAHEAVAIIDAASKAHGLEEAFRVPTSAVLRPRL